MKKVLKFNLVLCLSLLCFCVSGCFGPRVEKLRVQYTLNNQLFVGEEWFDDLVVGTAVYSDDTEKDVTDKLNIDTSEYDKDTVGEYTITFEYEDIEVSYDVSVVTEMTNTQLIHQRIDPLVDSAFSEIDGIVEFSASYIQAYTTEYNLKQTIHYKKENNIIKEYYKLDMINNDESISITLLELLFNGTESSGTMTYNALIDDNDSYISDSTTGTFEEFENTIPQLTQEFEINYLNATQFLNIKSYYQNTTLSKLTKDTNTYTVTFATNSTMTIDNTGFITNWGGIDIYKTTNIPTELSV